VRHPWPVVLVWAVAIALGAWGAHHLARVALGSEGGVPGSPSRLAGDALRTEFTNPFIDPLVVAVSAPQLTVDAQPYSTWLQATAKTLAALPQVRRVASYADSKDAQLRSADGHVTMLVVGLAAADNAGRQHGVVAVRAALSAPRAQLVKLDPAARLAVTGGAAADYDVNTWSATGGDRAEKRALPLTLLILALAFGTLVAASLPFLMGLATTTVSLGLAYLLAELMPVSNLLSNVVTMIGLAIGIDYSLLMVTHYREHDRRATVAETVADTVAVAGRTISWSGLTVIIGLLGLLFSPILETRCVGIGGALVVCVSVLAALTLLPAILVLLGPRIDSLAVLPQRLRRSSMTVHWRRLGGWIVRHPLVTLLVAGAFVLALGAPALQLKSGFSNERWFLPAAMESRVGAEILTAIRSDNASQQINAIVRPSDGLPVLASQHLAPLVHYAEQLARDPRIATVNSAFSLRADLGLDEYSELYSDPDQALHDYPTIAELYLSRDRHAALFEITPAKGVSVQAIAQLTRDLARVKPAGPFSVSIGGTPAEHNDFNDYMFRSLPRIFGFVIGATLLLLFVAFRSYLLPFEAVLMNLLAVGAGIGAVVAIFQFGWATGLVGLERPFSSIALEIPLMVFCLSFGLSMDYELFLLFRIQQEYRRERNNNRAIIEGLAAVAPVITGAGLIMVVVFGAFVAADLPVLKMTGVGLCVAVFIDATVIRAFVVPALMALGGRWNWYPGRRPRD
jgi:putative drug exporter of the RND superfamily